MSGRRRRLQRIEIGLTPTQAVALWLQEAHRFESLQAHSQWLAGQPDAAFPLYRLHDLVVPAVEQAMKRAEREERDQAVRAALREVGFLFFVHQQANARILSDWRALRFGVAMLTHDPTPAAGTRTRGRGSPPGCRRRAGRRGYDRRPRRTIRPSCPHIEAAWARVTGT